MRTCGKLAMRVPDATSTLDRRVRKVRWVRVLYIQARASERNSQQAQGIERERGGEEHNSQASPTQILLSLLIPTNFNRKKAEPLFFSTVSGVFLQRSSPTVGSEHHGCLRSDSVHIIPGFTAGNYRKVSPFKNVTFRPKIMILFWHQRCGHDCGDPWLGCLTRQQNGPAWGVPTARGRDRRASH